MRELLLNRKLFKGLLMLLTILFALPQALAQKNYKIKTDGNCKVYYMNYLDEISDLDNLEERLAVFESEFEEMAREAGFDPDEIEESDGEGEDA